GSLFTLTAYYTDLPCMEDDWTEVCQAAPCTDCSACINNCPTHAIREDRFLIDNEKCLSFYNEGPGEIPEWVPLSAFQCVYDCLECQAGCPMNAEYLDHVIGPITFSEAETAMIMGEKDFHEFDPALQKKVEVLGMTQWLPAIPRNLRILFELESSTHG
ncbi:MAG TPA: 4Fe-4S double cluster binding domain-containing protein, partial [Clostridia bacterium]